MATNTSPNSTREQSKLTVPISIHIQTPHHQEVPCMLPLEERCSFVIGEDQEMRDILLLFATQI